MKIRLFLGVFLGLVSTIHAQVTYVPHIESIEYGDTTKVYWVAQSLYDQDIHINKRIVFVNSKTDAPSNTEVKIDLVRESKGVSEIVKKFMLPTGDEIESSLICDNVSLKIGDVLYFRMTLQGKDASEKFIFNIYNRQDTYKSIAATEKAKESKQEHKPPLYSTPKVNPFLSLKPKKQISDRRKKVNKFIYNLLTTLS